MILLRATTTNGKRECFNPDKILTLQLNEDGTRVKILMGAGLHWWVWAGSMALTNINEIMED